MSHQSAVVRPVAHGRQLGLTEATFSTSDLEGSDDSVADLEVLDGGTDTVNDTTELMPEKVPYHSSLNGPGTGGRQRRRKKRGEGRSKKKGIDNKANTVKLTSFDQDFTALITYLFAGLRSHRDRGASRIHKW